MLHFENSRWSTVEQVERETVLKPAPPPPPSRREVVGGAVEQEQKSKVEQNTVEQQANPTPGIDPSAMEGVS